jgi:hypothetical protein
MLKIGVVGREPTLLKQRNAKAGVLVLIED